MTTNDFIAPSEINQHELFISKFSAPSNIALVKYWGKKDNQIPANPSLSFTLKNCKTITQITFTPHQEAQPAFSFYFEGKEKPSFHPKIEQYLTRILPYCAYLNHYHLKIETENTFPHSSGIASSASGMAALSANILALEKKLFPEITDQYCERKASFLARLGSGSACRSIKGNCVIWGENTSFAQSSDWYGIPFSENLHPHFQHYQDTILLVDKGEKTVSSTVGHSLMHQHPFASQRFTQAHENLSKLKKILLEGDLTSFIALVESEALTLHAMMMTSHPYFILMKPNTLEIIQKMWKFRNETQTPLCFTLDAGANVHVLYPFAYKEIVQQFITEELALFCQNQQYIHDEMGEGAIKLSNN